MKNTLFLVVLVAFPLFGFGQGKLNLTERLNQLELGGLENELINAAMSAECCFYDKCKCDDLKDPWEEFKYKSIERYFNRIEPDSLGTDIQSRMATLEKAILSGKGGKVLPKKFALASFKKHPGYSLPNVNKRLNDYIRRMESIEDDE